MVIHFQCPPEWATSSLDPFSPHPLLRPRLNQYIKTHNPSYVPHSLLPLMPRRLRLETTLQS